MTELDSTVHAICACGNHIAKFFKSGKPHKWCATCRQKKIKSLERALVTACYCGKKIEQGTAGPIRRYCCFDCGHQARKAAKGIQPSAAIVECLNCGGKLAKAGKKYCSPVCNAAYQRRKAGVVTRAEYLASARSGKGSFRCEYCNKDSYRKLSGTSKSPNRFCSMKCRKDAAAAKRPPELCVVHAAYCLGCGKPHVSRKKKLYCSEACRPKVLVSILPESAKCECCGVMYVPRSLGGRPSAFCGDECRGAVRAKQRRIYKSKRKAVVRAATIENVDPFAVFERDRWRCQLCGVKTPRSKRGSYDDDAPELDHIEPLSLGGAHSYLNTQCACRKCNGLKSNKPMGQMLLLG